MRGLHALISVVLLVPGSRAAPDVASGDVPAVATLVVEGLVVKRDEVWDRRSNPLMGRPDFLREIVLAVQVLRVRQGVLPKLESNLLPISFAGEFLLAGKRAGEGWTGVFSVRGAAPKFTGLGFEPGTPPAVSVAGGKPARERPAPAPVPFPENLSAPAVRADAALRARAVRTIANRFGMTGAEAMFLTSYSGPEPPPGGYQYWGVKGRIGGRMYVWQPGERKPHPGNKLLDPLRYQK